ncbi:cupredoxin domain-containing protein [Peribacillus frigoritolerans]|uniref:cupredoxin domain-containing protein n=1 Tax=Peribacillus frigoritolerans TaxID=450367 RepID=UPI0021D3D910|nr:cupredoxin domain-containing protein [Peribacillus frigoritolerans]MCU6602185.1 cupredoxin domain-containing protein [Peribacillus frigoritolerans]
MSVKKWVTGLVVMLATVVVVTSLGSFGVSAESRVVTQPAVKSIEVELNDDFFNPEVITIPNGTATTLILKNKGKKEHTFTVEKLGIDAEVQAGKEKTITVQPKQPGTYELICRYHFQEGMVGKVIVE